MKYKVSTTAKPEIYRLSVNLKLPKLDLRRGPFAWTKPLLTTGSPASRCKAATRLARLNRGLTPFELPDPVAVYGDFLDGLSLVEGLARLVGAGPYSIDFEVGELFEAEVVGRLLAELVRSNFYPCERLVLVA